MAAFVSNSGYTAVAARTIYSDAVGGSKTFKYMGIGSGSAAATNTASLTSECTDTGLTRATLASVADTNQTAGLLLASTTLTNDTCWFRNTWTCGVSSIASGVKECGVFNSNTGGDMLAYGTFDSAIPMGTGDTLQVTWSVQVKAGA